MCVTELNGNGRERARVSSDVILEGGLGFQLESFLFLSGSFSAQQKAIKHLDKENGPASSVHYRDMKSSCAFMACLCCGIGSDSACSGISHLVYFGVNK